MIWPSFHSVLLVIQHSVSLIGVLIIVTGVFLSLAQFIFYFLTNQLLNNDVNINNIRLNLARILVTGLEFIVAADLIGTTTAPDYYSVGILGIIVIIRTILSYTINKEVFMLSQNNRYTK